MSQKTYTVKKGDTLYGIAWKTGGNVNSLIQHNGLKAPYLIRKGQVLQLTSDKRLSAKKENSKGDLPSQNVNKKGKSDCTAQNCNKNNSVEVAQKKTKAYSANETDKKTIAKKNKKIKNAKVSGWSWPVKGKLTKRFSASQAGMQGISIVSKRGSSIIASASGKVVYAGSGLRGYGNLIIIKHNYDYLSAYAHNETLLVGENEQIKRGQKIAIMGDSGSDHVHLHFEIRYRGKSVDPLRYLPKR
ncbi:peptidoglycan DD-metalloendopeptidase family protein [Psychromonas hadalis]|uniref:peptidoglycan DD-metalloendopeptidase family protein n=1 Tax=Psychromonas hadalis TaxID=211669 RepID=UPI001FDF727D|nr:peptidoglycan DD-metalloendopeptidase family protein [Psychromonas hadalis]